MISEGRVRGALLVGSLLVPLLLLIGASTGRWSYAVAVLVIAAGSVFDLHNELGATGVRTALPGTVLLGLGPPMLLAFAPAAGAAGVGGVLAVALMVTFLLVFSSPRRHLSASVVASTTLAGLLVASGATALMVAYDTFASPTMVAMLVLVAVADLAVVVAARPAAPDRPARRLLAAAAAALPTAVVLYALAYAEEPAGVVLAGLAVAAILSAWLTARLRRVLRDGDERRRRPALLVGTADATLFAAPIATILVLAFAS